MMLEREEREVVEWAEREGPFVQTVTSSPRRPLISPNESPAQLRHDRMIDIQFRIETDLK